MDEASPKFEQRTLWDTDSATSSEDLQGGVTPSPSPDGPMPGPSGPHPARANHSARPGSKGARKTSGTSGRFCPPSSASVALTSWLGNRLVELLDTHGSMEYELTWSRKATPSGLRIFRLRASARRTSASGCTGWPSPDATSREHSDEEQARRLEHRQQKYGKNSLPLYLADAAKMVEPLAGWGTPTVQDASHASLSPAQQNRDQNILANQVYQTELSGWATPRAEDSESTGAHAGTPDTLTSQANLSGQAHHHGPTTASSIAGTARPVASALNPAMPRWLMSFPATWDQCSPHWDDWVSTQRMLADVLAVLRETAPSD